MAAISKVPHEILSTIFSSAAEIALSEIRPDMQMVKARRVRATELARLCLVNKAFNAAAFELALQRLHLEIPFDSAEGSQSKHAGEALQGLATLTSRHNIAISPLAATRQLSLFAMNRGRHEDGTIYQPLALRYEEMRESIEALVSALRPSILTLRLDACLHHMGLHQNFFAAVTSLTLISAYYKGDLSLQAIFEPEFRFCMARLVSFRVELEPLAPLESLPRNDYLDLTEGLHLPLLQNLELYNTRGADSESVFVSGFFLRLLETSELPRLRSITLGHHCAEQDVEAYMGFLLRIGCQLTKLGLAARLLRRLSQLRQYCPGLIGLGLVNNDDDFLAEAPDWLCRSAGGIVSLAVIERGRGGLHSFIYALRNRALLPELEILEIVHESKSPVDIYAYRSGHFGQLLPGSVGALSGLVKRRGIILTYSVVLSWGK